MCFIKRYIMDNDILMYMDALSVALHAHKHQVDKLGMPYIDHPIRVSLNFDDPILKSISVLHDVIEDAPINLMDQYYFSKDVYEVLDLLTHTKYDSYHKYIRKLSVNPMAVKVKIADLIDNTDPHRMKKLYEIDPKTAIRVSKKYIWALQYLKDL